MPTMYQRFFPLKLFIVLGCLLALFGAAQAQDPPPLGFSIGSITQSSASFSWDALGPEIAHVVLRLYELDPHNPSLVRVVRGTSNIDRSVRNRRVLNLNSGRQYRVEFIIYRHIQFSSRIEVVARHRQEFSTLPEPSPTPVSSRGFEISSMVRNGRYANHSNVAVSWDAPGPDFWWIEVKLDVGGGILAFPV